MQQFAFLTLISTCLTGQVAPLPTLPESAGGVPSWSDLRPDTWNPFGAEAPPQKQMQYMPQPLPRTNPRVAPPQLAMPMPKALPGRPLPKRMFGPGGVRRDLGSLDPDSPTMQSFRRAVEAMRRLPATDPHSLFFQANIHGFDPAAVPNPDPTWGQCQHGNWWFLPWHRAYLVHLERIMRRYANDPTFCLPYWDYASPQQRTLPVAFRQPGSPLYDSSRRAQVNDGSDQLDPAIVVAGANASMANTVFADFGPMVTFGGQALNAPEHLSRPHGALESVPHDMVHVFVGGNMSSTFFAARDPIFLVHHANVDRLWVEWLAQGQGRANPANDVWLNQRFTFFDENKQPVTIAIRDMLDTATLGYTYERTGNTPAPAARAVVNTTVETLVTVQTPGQAIGTRPVQVALRVPEANFGKLQKNLLGARWPLAQIPSQVQLRLEGVKFSGPPDSCVAVYLNLPKNTIPDPQSPFFAGCFTFFGPQHHEGPEVSQLDVTKHLQRLWPYSERGSRDISVTLVRHSCGVLTREFQTICTCSQVSLTACK